MKKKALNYDNVYQVYGKQIGPEKANYNPMGMAKGKACANCNWFISPNSCLLVSGDISPTGMSDYWMESLVSKPDPMEVTVVDSDGSPVPLAGKSGEGSFIKVAIDKVKSLLTPNITEESTFGGAPMMFFKSTKEGAGDALRFVATVSNNFKDREAEIITEEAHQEYVSWVTKSGYYPELWLWHAGAKSKWGQVDWLDVCDGFLIASGTVDSGKEHIARAVAKDGKNVGVSHGFYNRKSGNHITQYRTFEISPLPLWAAANEWTAYNILENDGMPFSEEKKKWLIDKGWKPEAVNEFEAGLSDFAKELKARGVDYKDYTPEPEAAPPVTVTTGQIAPVLPVDGTPAPIADTKAIDDVVARMTSLETNVKTLTDAFLASVAKLSKSQDEKVADFFKSAVDTLPQGFQASASNTNTDAANTTAAELAEKARAQKENGWFSDIVLGGMK